MDDLSNRSKEDLIAEIERLRLQLEALNGNTREEIDIGMRRYDLANEATQDGIYDWNLVTNEIFYNSNWKKMLGYSDDELPNDFKVWETHTLPEDVEKSWKMQNELINKKRDRFVLEFKMKHKDGHWVDILSRAVAVFDDTGKAIRIVGTHVDITEKKQVMKALEASEKRFRTLTNMAPAGIYLTDLEGNCTYANPKWLQMAGMTLDQALGKGWTTALHPDDHASIESSWYASHDSRTTWNHDFRFQTAEGKLTWVHGLAEPIVDAEGKLSGYMGVNIDITELKESENVMKENKMFLDKILDTSALSTWISDENGLAIRANKACLEFFGATEDEVVGKYNLLKDEVLQSSGCMPQVEKVFSEGKVANIIMDYDFDAVDHVKVEHATHKIINSIITPIVQEDGRVNHAVIQTIDLTDIKNAEKELLEEKLKAEQYLDIAEVMLVSLDRNGHVQLINPKGCNILGYSKEEILGKNWFEMFLPESQKEEVRDVAEKVFQGEMESVKYHENEVVTKDGEERLIAFRNSMLYDEKGQIIGTLSSGEDITDRIKNEKMIFSHLDFLKRVNILLNKALNRKQLLTDVLKETLDFFDVDRSWLVKPCNPAAESWSVEMECNKADFPGAFASGKAIPMNDKDADQFKMMQDEPNVVELHFDHNNQDNKTADTFSVLSKLLFTLRLSSGDTYLLGLHQCAYDRKWTKDEKNLFREVGNRLADALNRLQFVTSLENSEAKFKSLFESGLLGILFWDAQGGITDANQVFLNMVGYTKDELLSGEISWKDLTPSEYEKKDQELIMELAEKGSVTAFEKEYFHKNGHRIPILIGAATLNDKTDTGVAFILDITEKKAIEEELKNHRQHLENRIEERTKALNRKNKELDDALKVFVGRELTIKKLQKKIAELEKKKE